MITFDDGTDSNDLHSIITGNGILNTQVDTLQNCAISSS